MAYNILVVDDDYSVVRTVKRVLESKGYKVDSCSSGREALEYLEKKSGLYDLILLDIMMADLDGNTTFFLIKRKYPDMKIIFLSAVQPSPEAKETLRKEGSEIPNIRKPFDIDHLVKVIEERIRS